MRRRTQHTCLTLKIFKDLTVALSWFKCVFVVGQERDNMQAEMALKDAETDRQRKRIRELEEMQLRLEEALHQEIRARQNEEAYRLAQAR